MFRNAFFLFLSFLFCAAVSANTVSHTVFAVDLSLSSEEKDAAFKIIKATMLSTPETHSVGLTLFDDTVRGFVAPMLLDEQQREALHQSIDNAPESVRSTSNLAVGIERAIDAFTPVGGANLLVFSKGAIDTESHDPRAQFVEWMELVLLQQAQQSNIAIKMVVSQNQIIDKQIKTMFAQSNEHGIIVSTSGTQVSPELVSMLNIPQRAYGESLPADAQDEILNVLGDEASQAKQAQSSAEVQTSPELPALPIVRLVLLAILLPLLIGILIWRYRSRRALKIVDQTSSHSSSSYLPLTQKPSATMDHYVDKSAEMKINSDSRDKD